MRFEKIVICPVKKDQNGKIVTDEFMPPPYGCHHILGIYPDGSSWPIATIDVSIDPTKAAESVKYFADDMPPIEIDPDYYRKRWVKDHPEHRYKFLD